MRWTDVVVRHVGYQDPALRRRKLEIDRGPLPADGSDPQHVGHLAVLDGVYPPRLSQLRRAQPRQPAQRQQDGRRAERRQGGRRADRRQLSRQQFRVAVQQPIPPAGLTDVVANTPVSSAPTMPPTP